MFYACYRRLIFMAKKFILITLVLIILAVYPAHAQDRAWKIVRQGGM